MTGENYESSSTAARRFIEQREIVLPDEDLVDLCHIVRGIVDSAVAQPELLQQDARVLVGIPHNNEQLPVEIRAALGPTNLNSLRLIFNSSETSLPLLSIQADDQNRPGRQITFTEIDTDRTRMMIEDNEHQQMASLGFETPMAIPTDIVSYWLACQLTEDRQAARDFVDREGYGALHSAANLLASKALSTHTVKIAGIMLPTDRMLSVQYSTSQANTGPSSPLVRGYTAWLTAEHDASNLDDSIHSLTERLLINFSPEVGVAESKISSEHDPTSVRVEYEALVDPRTDLKTLVINKAKATEDGIIPMFQKIALELRAVA